MSETFQKETVLKGLPLSGGVAIARVCRFNQNRHSNLDIYKVAGAGVDREIERTKKAVKIAADRIEVIRQETLKKIGPAEAEIFTAQRLILEDKTLQESIEKFIKKEKSNAEAAVMVVLDSYEARMRELDDEYIKDRASDLGEIKRRILDVLSNMNPEFQCADLEHCQRGRNRIVVAEELTPRLTIELDTAHTMGFVTEHGGVNSHAAILARALGIPAVSGVDNIHGSIMCGTEVIVNGNTGEVIVWPSENTVADVRKRTAGAIRVPQPVDPIPGFEVMGNISLSSEVGEAVNMKAEGIGLYRTEFEFMGEGAFLDEHAQYERYSAVVKAMNGLPVTFRLFDAGGDKPLPFLEIPQEDNPALGWRGGRLLLGHSALMKAQARALARASQHGPVNILYPMIVDLKQFQKLRDSFNQAIEGLPTGEIRHGVMFEVPSACLQSEAILEAADFGSIGTNDLIQYLFAVDRNNELVAYDYSPDRPVFWSLIEKMAGDAERLGKPLSVCGELAGDPKYVPQLIRLGIKSISVSARLIPGARLAAATLNAECGARNAELEEGHKAKL